VIHRNDPIPDGFEVVEKMLSVEKFHESNTSSFTRLAVKRSPQNLFIQGAPIIDDICVVNASLGETSPREYVWINKAINNTKGSIADKIFLAYHHRSPLGLCDIPFEAVTLDRYPSAVRSISLPISSSYCFNLYLMYFRTTLKSSYRLKNCQCLFFHMI
jgi:hypothetical protein